MFVRRNGFIALLIGLHLSLTGCESLDLELDKNQIIGSFTAAAGCALISKETGGDDEEIAAAAIVCGVVGYAVTNKLENDRKEYANDEEFYKAETERLSKYDAELSQQIKVSEAELMAAQLQIDEVTARNNRSESDQANLAEINSDLLERQAYLAQELSIAEENLSYQKGLNVHMLETKGAVNTEAEVQLAALEASVSELNQLLGAHEQQSATLGAYL